MSDAVRAPARVAPVAKAQDRNRSSLRLQRQCACGARASGAVGECESCRKKRTTGLQAKLQIGSSTDRLELEADRVAEQVLAMSGARSSGAPAGQADAPPRIQRATAATPDAALGDAPPIVDDVLRSPGRPMDAATRSYFEPRFGHDFGQVRIHAGGHAARSADAVGALAYTVGNDIVFASGEYAPASATGRKLIAHELTHVMQQQGPGSLSRIPVLQRQPAQKRTGRILSLEEVKKDAERKRKQELNGQSVARVYRNTKAGPSEQNCPTTLEPNTLVTIVKILPGELWIRIEATGIKNVDPGEMIYVHAAFVKEITAAAVSEPKPVPAQEPKQENSKSPELPKDPTEAEQIRSLIESRPKEYKFDGDELNPKTNKLMNGLLFSKYLWFRAPKHRQRAIDFIERAYKEHHEKSLGIWEYEKAFGGLHSLENRQMTPFFLAARDALKHFHEYTRKSRAGWEDERNWDADIEAMKRAMEPISVLLDGRKPADMAQFEKGRSMLRFEAPKAFVNGVLEGAKSELTDADYKLLAQKLGTTSLLALPLMPVAAAGTAAGVAKDIYDTLKGLYEMVTQPVEMAKQMIELIMTLMLDKESARQIGVAIGQQEGKEIAKLAKEDLVTFTYKLYEKVGPLVVSVALSFVTGGSAGAARMGMAFEKILSRSQRARAIVKKVEALLPERKKLPKLPDPPHDEPRLPKLPDAHKAPDVPKVDVPVPKTTPKLPNFDDAIAARKWAKETLKLTDETLEGMSPGAYKRLGELAEGDLDRLRNLSESARRYLLGCESPCPVDGPDIKNKLGKYTNDQIENLARMRADKRRKNPGKKLKKPDEPPSPSEVPDVAPKPTKEWAKKALDLDDAYINNYGPNGIKELFKLAESDLARIRKLPRNVRLALLDSGKPGKINLADIEHHLAKFTDRQIEILYHDEKLGKGVRIKMTDKQHTRLRRVAEALEDPTKWGVETDKDLFRLGRKYDEVAEVLTRAASGTSFHHVDVDAGFIAKLRKTGGKVVITEGKLKGGKHRFDLLQIDFDKKRAELIDLASRPKKDHVDKTRRYKELLEKELGMPVDAKEIYYTGPKGELLEDLVEVPVK